MARRSCGERRITHNTWFDWFLVNLGPFVSLGLSMAAIFDTAHAAKWAAAAAAVAAWTGGGSPSPVLNGGLHPTPGSKASNEENNTYH